MALNKNKKYSALQIVAVVFCAMGLLLMVAEAIFETGKYVSILQNVLLAIGLIAFVLSFKSNKLE